MKLFGLVKYSLQNLPNSVFEVLFNRLCCRYATGYNCYIFYCESKCYLMAQSISGILQNDCRISNRLCFYILSIVSTYRSMLSKRYYEICSISLSLAVKVIFAVGSGYVSSWWSVLLLLLLLLILSLLLSHCDWFLLYSVPWEFQLNCSSKFTQWSKLWGIIIY